MQLTKKQEEGLRLAIARYKNKEKYTVIAGFAGSGKSTLIKFIVEALKNEDDITDEDIVYTCFTGKACNVLIKKGLQNSFTLHKLLYESKPLANGQYLRLPKDYIDAKIVVVDEVSMAPKELIDALFTYDVYVICCGDPGQLPPISKNDDNHLLDHPHVFLDEIMRQAQESEIIRLTMDIRNGKSIPNSYDGKEVKIFPKKELNSGMLLWADQILTATNNTRININNTVRKLLNKPENPANGDKVICLRNYWDDVNDNFDALVNGTIGTLKNVRERVQYIPKKYDVSGIHKFNVIDAKFVDEFNSTYDTFNMDKQLFINGKNSLDWNTSYKLMKNKYRYIIPYEFTYGYAITCWKAQGSEWEKVLVIEENFPFDKEEHKKFLYTAITRASDKVVLIR